MYMHVHVYIQCIEIHCNCMSSLPWSLKALVKCMCTWSTVNVSTLRNFAACLSVVSSDDMLLQCHHS